MSLIKLSPSTPALDFLHGFVRNPESAVSTLTGLAHLILRQQAAYGVSGQKT